MRHILISALLLSLVSACTSVKLGPHRIDVQQGNALDQENVSRLKTGLNRSQVRFLLGTPLVIDPFRTDRWDYVYVNYKSGKLAEQKGITLFFDGETLVRIEGDLPAPEPVAQPVAAKVEPKVELKSEAVSPSAVEVRPLPQQAALKTESIPAAPAPAPAPKLVAQPSLPQILRPSVFKAPQADPARVISSSTQSPPANSVINVTPTPKAAIQTPVESVVQADARLPVSTPSVSTSQLKPQQPQQQPVQSSQVASSIVHPLPSPKNVPPYVDPRTPVELSLQAETNVAQIKSDVIPAFPEPRTAMGAKNDVPVLSALNAWADAWSRRDGESYLAAYDSGFVPQGGGSRADWEKSRRLLLGLAKQIELKIDSPSVDHDEEGIATVTFNQFYRSDSYRDAIVKQLRMVERGGRWLIIEEKMLSTLRGAKR